MQITVVGLDIAKHVFQTHAADADGRAVAQVKLRRAQVLDYFRGLPPCLVGLEACATAHHWARELIALGHTVRLMPPAYVKSYVKRNKTDAADAEAIAEALTRPTMRFVPVKSVDQQSMLMLHRVRELLVRQRTMLATALRAHLAEFGITRRSTIQDGVAQCGWRFGRAHAHERGSGGFASSPKPSRPTPHRRVA